MGLLITKKVEYIFKKYWHILCIDRDVGPVLPKNPQFIYKKAPNVTVNTEW